MRGVLYRLDFCSGKSYIGITTGKAQKRYKAHATQAAKGNRTLLYEAWRKHGAPAMVVIGNFETKEDLMAAEISAITANGTRTPGGYNITPGGDFSPMLLPDVAKRLGESRKGLMPVRAAFEAALLATKGKKRPADVVARMSLNGSMRRPEVRAKQAATMATFEFKVRFSAAHALRWAKKLGRPFSEFTP